VRFLRTTKLMLEIKLVSYAQEINAIKSIRESVFQHEQNVPPELEFDEYDEDTAQHLLAYLNAQPVGTCRVRVIDAQTGKIERVAVLAEARGQKIGQKLTENALEYLKNQNCTTAVVNAQEYVKTLYEKLGFIQVGETFDEADIPHVKMIKKL